MTDTSHRQTVGNLRDAIEDWWHGNTDSAKADREAESRERMDQATRLLAIIAAQHRLDQTLGRSNYTPPPSIRDSLSYGQVLVRAVEMLNARPYGKWVVEWASGKIIVTPPVGREIEYPTDDLGWYFGNPDDKEDFDRRAESMAHRLAESTRYGIDVDRSRDTLHFKSLHHTLNQDPWASVNKGDIIHMMPDDPLSPDTTRYVVYYIDTFLLFLVREDGEMVSLDLPLDTNKWRLCWKELPSVGYGCINDDCREDRIVRCPICKEFMDEDQLWLHVHWEHVRQWRKEMGWA